MLDRRVTVPVGSGSGDTVDGTVYDVAMEQGRTRDWMLSRVAVQEPAKGLRRRGQTHVVEWRDVRGLAQSDGETQGATHLLHALNEMRPADAATMLHELPPERRAAVVAALDDERLADVLEEMPEEDQVAILERLDSERAADVLEEMSADDAADLIADLPPETAEILLDLMEPDEAEDVRRLHVLRRGHRRRDDDPGAGDPRHRRDRRRRARPRAQPRADPVAGRPGLRVPLARWRPRPGDSSGSPTSSDCSASRPRRLVAGALDESLENLRPEATITEVALHLATYNLVAAPVVDENGHLLGAVTVDDLLDHMLPAGWRDRALTEGSRRG